MKIAVWHNLPSGGGKRALYHEVEGLLKRGHTLEAWCPPTADQSFLPLQNLIPEHVIPLRETVIKDKPTYSNVVAPYRTMRARIAAMDEHCEACAHEIDGGGFDLLYADCCQFFRATAIGRMVHIPKSLYLHEPYRWLYEALPTLPWPALPPMESWSRVFPFAKTFIRDLIRTQSLRIQAREELRNVTGFDRVFVNSSFSRESVLRAFGLDATVLSLGVSTDVFRPDGAKRERFAVGVGSFTHAKGIDIAIRGIAAVRRVERPELVWICNIVSQGLAERLRSLADSLGVKLTLKIGIPDSEVVSALNRASMLLYTSRLEPFGFAPLEANACETPVVAIAEGGVRETIQHEVNGLLVPDYDPEKLGEAITRLLENPVFAAQLGKRGRQMVLDSWTWDSSVDNLERNLMLIANARKSFEAT